MYGHYHYSTTTNRTMSMLDTILSLVLLLSFNGTNVSVATESSSKEFKELKNFIEHKVEELKQTCDQRYKEMETKLHTQSKYIYSRVECLSRFIDMIYVAILPIKDLLKPSRKFLSHYSLSFSDKKLYQK